MVNAGEVRPEGSGRGHSHFSLYRTRYESFIRGGIPNGGDTTEYIIY